MQYSWIAVLYGGLQFSIGVKWQAGRPARGGDVAGVSGKHAQPLRRSRAVPGVHGGGRRLGQVRGKPLKLPRAGVAEEFGSKFRGLVF